MPYIEIWYGMSLSDYVAQHDQLFDHNDQLFLKTSLNTLQNDQVVRLAKSSKIM